MNSPSVRAGIVGLGYWGPNIARNLAAIPGCELTWCCERSSEARIPVTTTSSPTASAGAAAAAAGAAVGAVCALAAPGMIRQAVTASADDKDFHLARAEARQARIIGVGIETGEGAGLAPQGLPLLGLPYSGGAAGIRIPDLLRAN